MSEKLRARIEALPRVRLTGEQLDTIDPDPEKHHWVDWDEHEDFVALGALRAALAQPSEPGVDVSKLLRVALVRLDRLVERTTDAEARVWAQMAAGDVRAALAQPSEPGLDVNYVRGVVSTALYERDVPSDDARWVLQELDAALARLASEPTDA